MGKAKIAITLEEESIEQLDRLVSEHIFQNRSKAIQEAVVEKLRRIKQGCGVKARVWGQVLLLAI